MKRLSLLFIILILLFSSKTAFAAENSEEITISFAGDCTLGSYKGQGTGNQFGDYFNEFGPDYFFENVRDIFLNDDITFVNLEGPLTDKIQTAQKQFPIKGNPEYINILKNSSIEVCNLANNHIYDCGTDGLIDTVNLLKANNISYCGEKYSSTLTKKGIKISFLGYRGFSSSQELIKTIQEDINNLRKTSDIICVMFHFGEERNNYSNSTQELLAHTAIDSGADIVVGNHPHVIQGIEVYKGKTICYSLGNFSFGANKNPKDKDTFIFSQTFEIKDKKVSYKEFNIIPCKISSVTSKNDYKPTPSTGEDKNKIIDRLIKYSEKYEETLNLECLKES